MKFHHRISVVVVTALLAHVACTTVSAQETPPVAKAPFNAEQAQAYRQQWAKHIDRDAVYTNSIGMQLQLIPPGEFTMGRTEEQFDKVIELAKKRGMKPARATTWEMLMMPGHRVRITKPFYLGATEVTVAQYRQFCEESGYKTEAEQGLNGGVAYKGRRPICTWRKPMVWIKLQQADDEPVLHLCWNDCVAFCKWLSEKEGVEYCLPTEAEWEYACRAGTTTAWSFGNFEDFDRLGHEYMFVSDGKQGKHDRPSRVAQKKPNAFGLYDMHGNVWEYVADWWHRFTYKNSLVNDPIGPPEQSEKGDMRRIIRTGSFDWGRWGAQSVYRMRIGQRSTQHPHQGFRVAMRIKHVEGVPLAVEPFEERRKKTIDPGPQKVNTSAAGKLPKNLTIDLPGKVKMDFVLIPPGSFLMGSSKGFGDETPVHRVVISKPFYMAKYEVTTAQWAAVLGKDDRFKFWESMTAEHDDAIGPNKAMRDVSWDDCQQFAAALKKNVPGRAFALPTEAQWEYACRAGATTEFHFGDDASKMGEYAWYAGNMIWPGGGRTFADGTPAKGVHYHDVGQKKPNAFGLYDMHGGNWEWCADYFDKDYYIRSPLKDPAGPESGRFRTLRGGSWFRYDKYCRSAYRRFFYPASNGDGVTAYISDFGCRLAINLDDASTARHASSNDPQVAQAPFSTERAQQLQQHWARENNKPVVETNSIGMKLTLIPPGEFMMGTTEEKLRSAAESSTESQWYQSVLSGGKIELPSHRVRMTKPFYLGSTEVTVGQFRQFAEESGYKTEAERGLLYARSAYRHSSHPDATSSDFGFRVVINAGLPLRKKIQRAVPANSVAQSVERSESVVDYTKLARSLVRYPNNPVIKVGEKGEWNDQTLGCFTVLADGDQFYFYSGGAQFGKRKNVGMATSKDGIHWTYYEQNPLFPGSMPYAIKVGDTFRLYHPGDGGLQMRTSEDGFGWSEPRKVMDGCLDPCVNQVGDNKFHLYFCSGGKINKGGKQVWQFKNYVATSNDGITWNKQPNPVLPLGPKGSWDEGSHAGSCVLKLPDGFHMWYLGSGSMDDKIAWRIGHATSPDGLTWTKSSKKPVLDVGKPGAWDQGTFMSFDIIFRDGKLLFWYAAAPTGHEEETKMKIQIGHGTSS